jgi:DNA-binding CsgD family transcriptional regulator
MTNVLAFTQRERQVMELLARGLTTKEVARRLGIAPATARRHIGSAAGRLGAADRRAAVAAFRQQKRRKPSPRGRRSSLPEGHLEPVSFESGRPTQETS